MKGRRFCLYIILTVSMGYVKIPKGFCLFVRTKTLVVNNRLKVPHQATDVSAVSMGSVKIPRRRFVCKTKNISLHLLLVSFPICFKWICIV